MKRFAYLIIALSISLAACTKKEAVPPPSEDVAAPPEIAAAPATEVTESQKELMGTSAFIEHMHHHASQLGQLNAALEVGSLAAAQRPAYWLAGHEEIGGVPDGWQVYIDGMHDAANMVDSARDISEARAAAKQIEASCHGCHKAAGVDVTGLLTE